MGLYLHIPFCESKCGYCDFYSVAVKDRDTAPLVDMILRELEARVAGRGQDITTVFCGGGTPTILPVDQLSRVLGAIRRATRGARLDEFTVEANPATVDDEKASLLVEAGVTRISMGAQSFFPDELATLERLHTPEDIAPSVSILRRNGVPQINLDLIFGIPGQTVDTWARSLDRAIALEPDHVACYGLTYEPGTRLTAQRATGRLTACDEQWEADMYLKTIDRLEAAGYEQYEISNFARPGCACQHNLIYWRNWPYLGVGPSAAGCVDGRRYKNVSDIAGYIRSIDQTGHAELESEVIEGVTLMLEMILMQLRLVEGLSIADFETRTGVNPLSLFQDVLKRLAPKRVLTVTDTHIALTRRGRLIADRIMTELACAIDRPSIPLPVLA